MSQEYSDFSARLYEKTFRARVPSHGHFELTFRCALKCGFCYCSCYTGPEHAGRELATPEVLRILDEAAAGGCLWMTFSGGDPFIRPDFRKIYDHALDLGMIVSIFCSGLLMTDEWLEHLKATQPLKIELPLYGVTAETYEAVAGRSHTFGPAVRNIRKMLAAGLPVKLKTKITRGNLHETGLIRDFVEKELGLEFFPNYYLYPRLDGSRVHLSDRLSVQEIVQLERVFTFDSCDSGTEAMASMSDPRLFRCAAGVNSFYINPWGELNFCTYVREGSWDLRKGSISDGVAALRNHLLSRSHAAESACGSCKIQSSCQNCPGHAVLETGELGGRSEYLCSVNHGLNGVHS
ncbi:MAG: radical SAM protein [Bdellovibrionales bacterium]|nr:radical SAM protein [Bdellovibrionales bacterium]